VPVERQVRHRGWKISRRRTRGREGKQIALPEDAAGFFVDQFRVSGPHGNLKDAGLLDISADADEFHTDRAVLTLSFEPVGAASKNRRGEREGLDVVDDCGLVPEAVCSGKRWLVSRFGALAFDRFQQSAFFSADVAAGADEDFEIEIQVTAKDLFSEKS